MQPHADKRELIRGGGVFFWNVMHVASKEKFHQINLDKISFFSCTDCIMVIMLFVSVTCAHVTCTCY